MYACDTAINVHQMTDLCLIFNLKRALFKILQRYYDFNLQSPLEYWNSAWENLWVRVSTMARTNRSHAPVVADSLYLPG
jgi:hypothetical protein